MGGVLISKINNKIYLKIIKWVISCLCFSTIISSFQSGTKNHTEQRENTLDRTLNNLYNMVIIFF